MQFGVDLDGQEASQAEEQKEGDSQQDVRGQAAIQAEQQQQEVNFNSFAYVNVHIKATLACTLAVRCFFASSSPDRDALCSDAVLMCTNLHSAFATASKFKHWRAV